MDDLSLLKGLSFVDAFFPGGGYAHSFGLEAAVREGVIPSGEALEAYMAAWLSEAVAPADGVACSAAHRAAGEGNMDRAMEADRQLDAMKICRETRAASRQMGRQVVKTAAERLGDPLTSEFHRRIENGSAPGHHPIAMGWVLGTCGWTESSAAAAFMYQTAVGAVSAAMRLCPIGQAEGQRILHGLHPLIGRLAGSVRGRGPDEMTAWAPLHEIRSMRQHRLEVRLFRS